MNVNNEYVSINNFDTKDVCFKTNRNKIAKVFILYLLLLLSPSVCDSNRYRGKKQQQQTIVACVPNLELNLQWFNKMDLFALHRNIQRNYLSRERVILLKIMMEVKKWRTSRNNN